ncbi:MAG TPA: 4a-hydroxytetrahydrobiopterin dehydratase [Terriglobia bacterium]|nr:4a-hydroxytetrahydrobiopterin dehydratase [Terriglobia bacterium]
MADLAGRHCVPCEGGTSPLAARDVAALRDQIGAWDVVSDHHLTRVFKFPDFHSALMFVNRVGEIADAEGHHPDIALSWGRVEVTLWTHSAGGLTENDFIVAAKIDRL